MPQSPITRSHYIRPRGVRARRAAGGVVFRYARGRIYILLTRQAEFTHYILPKGGVEDGETLADAARREIAEEAGVDQLTLVGPLGVRSRLGFSKKRWTTTHYLLFCSDQLRPGEALDDRYEARWFNIDKLPPILWPEQSQLISLARGKIRKYLGNTRPGRGRPGSATK